ncbi:MAG: hypothetical protein F6J98_36080 [Moorea sp. SIO4G2]|uniref:hypothetical protein n=1 Tax=unclassified Moorena TaxID=2683338 RepID=UPI0013C1B1CA|nr:MULTISPECIES: hypothetical protein [unclassified Moorena]NEO06559.1 hypothetical protein [Moorena sp. SIO3I8]NEO19987.1 hypothetical protein [Moorena sp. SIO4A5]NEO65521.1 hypothetical protein [Moorena sp. SIO4G2]NEQ59438.1 hypothetical protein [Moorena sp. SIO4A1]
MVLLKILDNIILPTLRTVPCSRLDAVAHGGNPQDRLGALSVGELNSPRVAPLHRYSLFPKIPKLYTSPN